eukprot:TRINITY_DN2847_c0_g1_i3.p1 TRINITY_DN2847_c0_g1~~TRINITY_DN2847_c0_g1_i3.p1  ORF type:complete len:414 (+),score=91.13 TRINITY_DN2847_c0_g1_i3:46-1287(+)
MDDEEEIARLRAELARLKYEQELAELAREKAVLEGESRRHAEERRELEELRRARAALEAKKAAEREEALFQAELRQIEEENRQTELELERLRLENARAEEHSPVPVPEQHPYAEGHEKGQEARVPSVDDSTQPPNAAAVAGDHAHQRATAVDAEAEKRRAFAAEHHKKTARKVPSEEVSGVRLWWKRCNPAFEREHQCCWILAHPSLAWWNPPLRLVGVERAEECAPSMCMLWATGTCDDKFLCFSWEEFGDYYGCCSYLCFVAMLGKYSNWYSRSLCCPVFMWLPLLLMAWTFDAMWSLFYWVSLLSAYVCLSGMWFVFAIACCLMLALLTPFILLCQGDELTFHLFMCWNLGWGCLPFVPCYLYHQEEDPEDCCCMIAEQNVDVKPPIVYKLTVAVWECIKELRDDSEPHN